MDGAVLETTQHCWSKARGGGSKVFPGKAEEQDLRPPLGWSVFPQLPLLALPAATSRSGMGTPVPAPPPPSATSTPAGQPTAITRLHMQLHLHDLQQNASDLRNQLQQLKKLQVGTGEGSPTQPSSYWVDPAPEQENAPFLVSCHGLECGRVRRSLSRSSSELSPLGGILPSLNPPSWSPQLQNQETVKTMLRRTETEISVRVTDTMRKHEDPLQRQRSLVEEERLRYLNEEELITQQLK